MAGRKYSLSQLVTVTAPGGAEILGVIEDVAWEPGGYQYVIRSEAYRVKKWFHEDEIRDGVPHHVGECLDYEEEYD